MPRVRFDRVHLEQIVENLVTNTVRYGAAPVEVTTWLRAGGTGTGPLCTDAANR